MVRCSHQLGRVRDQTGSDERRAERISLALLMWHGRPFGDVKSSELHLFGDDIGLPMPDMLIVLLAACRRELMKWGRVG